MKKIKKLIIGAILGVFCVFSIFISNVKTKATTVTINPITSLDDVPIGSIIRFNDYITFSGGGATLQGEIYNGDQIICTTAGKNLIKIVFQNNSMRYYFSDGTSDFGVVNHNSWNNNGYKELTVVNNLYYYDTSGQNDNSASFIVSALNSNTTITYETTTPTTINITLNGNGGVHENGQGVQNPTITLTDLTIGDIATAINNTGPSWLHTGYSLVGWNTTTTATTALTNNELNAIQSSTTLYAVWRSNTTIQVSFQVNAPSGTTATGSVPSSEYVEQNSVYTLPGNTGNLAIEHYNFIGWNTYPGANSGLTTYETGRQNVIFFAIWQIEQKTLTLNLGGGNLPGYTTNTFNINYGTTVNLSTYGTPVKPGFIFLGWGTTADATEYVNNITMTSNKTVYAIYGTATQDLATITFNSNDATGGAVPGSVQVIKGQQYTLPNNPGELVRVGYTFIGWGLTSDATTPVYTITPSADMTLYAIWGELNYATVYLQVNGQAVGTTRIYNGLDPTFYVRFNEFNNDYFYIQITAHDGVNYSNVDYNYIWNIIYNSTDKYGRALYTFNGANIEKIIITTPSTTTEYDQAAIDLAHYSILYYYNNNDVYTINIITEPNTDLNNFNNIVSSVFNGAQTLLNIKVGWFSLGSLIAVVLAIGVLFFVIKMGKGGSND